MRYGAATRLLGALVAAAVAGSPEAAWARSKGKTKTWTEPEKAQAEDPDFSIQGTGGTGGRSARRASMLRV
jgi:hypothetical protein